MFDALRKRMLARDRKEQVCNFLVNRKSFVKPSECQLRPILSWPFEGSDHNISSRRGVVGQPLHWTLKMNH